ncbi:rhodanese-like domain-containing protein [Aurantiacibacter sp. D1-12]|uniref:rhodanese-like domain-containing protein n=1 Tax=Aurantiacibacter sp. D1-12 TaxID=2993658 RepID=UPI00237CA781|nr:rhodanese-like domain-containing protein [Aurantiacibacter sp. D1-12]MDE1467203.1 rhodanese-like domain-containing protein [Aurantiacibacter sp. D1-12]
MRAVIAIAPLALLAACSGENVPGAPVLAVVEQSDGGSVAQAAAVETLDAIELMGLIEHGEVVLVDVRTPAEFGEGRLPGSLNAPVETFDPASIPMEAERETILYCRSAGRSARAAQMLAEHSGGTVRHLEGGIIAWGEAGGEVITSPES